MCCKTRFESMLELMDLIKKKFFFSPLELFNSLFVSGSLPDIAVTMASGREIYGAFR